MKKTKNVQLQGYIHIDGLKNNKKKEVKTFLKTIVEQKFIPTIT